MVWIFWIYPVCTSLQLCRVIESKSHKPIRDECSVKKEITLKQENKKKLH
jgi:hypothetical protein